MGDLPPASQADSRATFSLETGKGFLCEKDADLGTGCSVKANGFVLPSSAGASPTPWPLGCCPALSVQVQSILLVTHFLLAFNFSFSLVLVSLSLKECFFPLCHCLSEDSGCVGVCIPRWWPWLGTRLPSEQRCCGSLKPQGQCHTLESPPSAELSCTVSQVDLGTSDFI